MINKKDKNADGHQAKQRVRQEYPTFVCVHTAAVHIEGGEEYRILPTSGWFETRSVGNGKTEEGAWRSALERISA